MENNTYRLAQKIIQKGEKLPKKHGSWYVVNPYENNYLVLDTWNKQIYHYPNGAKPSDTNNLYRVVYVFYNDEGDIHDNERVTDKLSPFWCGHF